MGRRRMMGGMGGGMAMPPRWPWPGTDGPGDGQIAGWVDGGWSRVVRGGHVSRRTRSNWTPISYEILGANRRLQPVFRSNFADTAFWAAAITTAADGTAEVEFPLPESLTTWKVKTWTMGLGTKVGQGESEIITTKDLLVRLQAPRFFVEKDEVVLSANVHNKLKTDKAVRVVLEFGGESVIQPMSETALAQTVEIAAGSEHRVDWRVKVAHAGEAVIRMKAITDEESDAAQMTFPAYVHGMLKTEAFAGAIRPDQEKGQVVLRVPAERKPEQSRLEVRYSPTLAGALVDALPYLADYPYGCTEQTLNRCLPTVITQKVLINLGLDLEAIRNKHTNLNAQEVGDARDRGKQQGRLTSTTPVFDPAEESRRPAAWHPDAWPTCSSPTAAGAGSPASESMPHRTRVLWSSTVCKSLARTISPCPTGCSNGASPGSTTTRSSRPRCSRTGSARSSRRTGRPPTIRTRWSSWS